VKRALMAAVILALSAGAVAASPANNPGAHRIPTYANPCRNGEVLAPTGGCECPPGTSLEGRYCLPKECIGGMVFSVAQNRCVCPQGQVLSGGVCVTPPAFHCGHGQIMKQGHCVCIKPGCGYSDQNNR
jgi:hypothetical protein